MTEKMDIPRLNQCYLCKSWQLEENLKPIEVPDQTGYVKKSACQKCLDEIIDKSGHQKVKRQGSYEPYSLECLSKGLKWT